MIKLEGKARFGDFFAFCFEFANFGLLSTAQGTIKEPEAIVKNFIRHPAFWKNMLIVF